MNFKRIITALIGLPAVIAIFVLGNIYLMDILFVVIASMSLHEYFTSFKEKAEPIQWIRIFSLYINWCNTFNS